MWKLDRRLRNTVRSIIKSRLEKGEESGYGDDLLGLMMGVSETSRNKHAALKLNMDEIIEECKTFYFAGHETTSNLLTWTVFLLSLHPEWQEKLREEVLRECETEIPDAEQLNKLKLVRDDTLRFPVEKQRNIGNDKYIDRIIEMTLISKFMTIISN